MGDTLARLRDAIKCLRLPTKWRQYVKFKPLSEQDLQAVFLIDNRRALYPLLKGENINTVNQLVPEWASLPTSEGKSAYDQFRAS